MRARDNENVGKTIHTDGVWALVEYTWSGWPGTSIIRHKCVENGCGWITFRYHPNRMYTQCEHCGTAPSTGLAGLWMVLNWDRMADISSWPD